MQEKEISQAVIRRMPRYYRYLGELLDAGVERISSNDLSKRMNVTASQIRQDLNNFGGFGQQGYGYNVAELRAETGVAFIPSLMSQFTPFYKAAEHGLGRRITTYEYRQVIDEAVRLGLTDGYMQEKSSAREEYTPPFDLEGV